MVRATRIAQALIAAIFALVLAACGGGAADAPLVAPLKLATTAVRGTLLSTGFAAYPRLVRLAHQPDARLDGRIVASVTQNLGGPAEAGFYASSDDGATFTMVGTLQDADFGKGLCCGTLFELPKTVGTLAAGTLVYAASVGQDTATAVMENRIYASTDAGVTFARLEGATCGRSAVPRGAGAGSGVWEPEFLVAADGSLACIYSDESEPGRSQVLKLTRTVDGRSWSAPRLIVTGATSADRPGMAVVRRLPSGAYLMSFESCSLAHLDCSARLKRSGDGLDWGDMTDLGTRPQTADGSYFRHAPTLAWAALPGHAAGLTVLIGQIVANDAMPTGVDPSSNGRALMVSTGIDGMGPWQLVSAPIGLQTASTSPDWCPNYSTPVLPSVDGSDVLLMQTDRSPEGLCTARFGTGSLGAPSD